MKRQSFNQITIRRQRESEINQAIEDLVKRGFVLKSGPTSIMNDGKVYDRNKYNRRVFRENTSNSMWIARLECAK